MDAHREVAFGEAFSLFFKNYANFQGRSSRGAYWWVTLGFVLLSVGVNILAAIAGDAGFLVAILGLALLLFSLASIIPGLALAFRRLHDTGRSAWWLLIGLIPLVGAIVLIVFYASPGQRAENKYGPDVEAGREAQAAIAA